MLGKFCDQVQLKGNEGYYALWDHCAIMVSSVRRGNVSEESVSALREMLDILIESGKADDACYFDLRANEEFWKGLEAISV